MSTEKKKGMESGERVNPSLETVEPYAFSRLTNKEWRREALERVDQLINQIKDNDIEELIFLDKSARPLSWLLRDRWKHQNNEVKLPKIKYIDLGRREKTGDELGEETVIEQMEQEAEDLYKTVDKDKKAKYSDDADWYWKKILFAQGEDADEEVWMSRKHISELWQDVVKSHPELLDQIKKRYGTKLGKTLIIDDLLFSGGTLRAAVATFTETYPEAEIFGVHFFNQETKSPETQIPWFKKQHMIGVEEDEDEDSLTTKRLSDQESRTPNLSKELRRIIKEIAQSEREE